MTFYIKIAETMYLHTGHNAKICLFAFGANKYIVGSIMSRPFGRSSMMFECHLCEVIYKSHHLGILY